MQCFLQPNITSFAASGSGLQLRSWWVEHHDNPSVCWHLLIIIMFVPLSGLDFQKAESGSRISQRRGERCPVRLCTLELFLVPAPSHTSCKVVHSLWLLVSRDMHLTIPHFTMRTQPVAACVLDQNGQDGPKNGAPKTKMGPNTGSKWPRWAPKWGQNGQDGPKMAKRAAGEEPRAKQERTCPQQATKKYPKMEPRWA